MEDIFKQLDLAEEALLKAVTDFPANAFRLTPGKRAGRYQHIKQLRDNAIKKLPGALPEHSTLDPTRHRDFNDSALRSHFKVEMPEHLRMTTEEAKTEKKLASDRLGRPVSGYKPNPAPKTPKM